MSRIFRILRKSSELLLLFFVFYTKFTVKIAPKTKPMVSSSSVVALDAQMGGSFMQEAPISGIEPFDLVFTIKGLEELS